MKQTIQKRTEIEKRKPNYLVHLSLLLVLVLAARAVDLN